MVVAAAAAIVAVVADVVAATVVVAATLVAAAAIVRLPTNPDRTMQASRRQCRQVQVHSLGTGCLLDSARARIRDAIARPYSPTSMQDTALLFISWAYSWDRKGCCRDRSTANEEDEEEEDDDDPSEEGGGGCPDRNATMCNQ